MVKSLFAAVVVQQVRPMPRKLAWRRCLPVAVLTWLWTQKKCRRGILTPHLSAPVGSMHIQFLENENEKLEKGAFRLSAKLSYFAQWLGEFHCCRRVLQSLITAICDVFAGNCSTRSLRGRPPKRRRWGCRGCADPAVPTDRPQSPPPSLPSDPAQPGPSGLQLVNRSGRPRGRSRGPPRPSVKRLQQPQANSDSDESSLEEVSERPRRSSVTSKPWCFAYFSSFCVYGV